MTKAGEKTTGLASATTRVVAEASAQVFESVSRVLLEVEAEGRSEWVTLAFHEGYVHASCATNPESPAHVAAALRALGLKALDGSGPHAPEGAPAPRGAPARGMARRESLRPPASVERDSPNALLADAFEDLVTAVVRVGVAEAAEAASVLAALDRLVVTAPSPPPLGLARFVGRLKHILVRQDVLGAARMLEEASRLASAARSQTPSRNDSERLRLMLGEGVGVSSESVSDRTLVELAREWVAGVEQGSIERRLMVDIRSGDLYAESRLRHGPASLGPCPRIVHVGLAEVDPGPAPRRIRVLQYELAGGLDSASYEGILSRADRRVAQLFERYQSALKSYPGLAETFVVFAPSSLSRDQGLVFLDGEGGQLALSRVEDAGRSAAIERESESLELEWVFGAIHETEERMTLDPYGFGFREEGQPRYRRLR